MLASAKRSSSEPASAGPALQRAPDGSASGPLWPSLALRIDPEDSPLEREADAVAARVLSSAPAAPSAPVDAHGRGIQRKCAECELEEEAEGKEQQVHGRSENVDDDLRKVQRHASDTGGAHGGAEAIDDVGHV